MVLAIFLHILSPSLRTNAGVATVLRAGVAHGSSVKCEGVRAAGLLFGLTSIGEWQVLLHPGREDCLHT